jgi:hypothetical protein
MLKNLISRLFRLTNVLEKPVQKKPEFSEKAFSLISKLLEKDVKLKVISISPSLAKD